MSEEESFVFRDKRRSAVGGAEEDKSEKNRDEPSGEKSPLEKPDTPAIDKSDAGETGRSGEKPPEINFSTFVLSLSTSAAMSLGGYQDPVSGHVPKNLELAKQSIDILGILEEKTKGNLDEEEKKLLGSALYDLRMKYVEEVKKSE